MIKFYITQLFSKKKLKEIIESSFSIIGGVWTIYQILEIVLPIIKTDIINLCIILTVLFLVINFIIKFPKRTMEYYIKNKDIKIKIIIGDMLKESGGKIIPTNTTFDTKREGDFISEKSVQGQIEEKYYKDNIQSLDTLIEKELNNIEKFKKLDRKDSKNKQYEIGTTIKLIINNDKYYFLAIADVNEFGQPKTSYENILISLSRLWEFILEKGHMEPIVIPILGTGRAGVNQSKENVIKQIIFSFIASNNGEKKISNELKICINPEDIKNDIVDIEEICNYVDSMCKYYYENIYDINNKMNGSAVEN